MDESGIVGAEALALIGTTGTMTEPVVLGALTALRFSEATHDVNMIYRDASVAEQYGYQSIPAQPMLIGQNMIGFELIDVPLNTPRTGGVLAAWKWEFIRPVLIEEAITAQDKILNIRQKDGSLGCSAHIEHQITFRDTNGETVAVANLTRVRY